MAIALGTNDLKPYRRHLAACGKPRTLKPITQRELAADNCTCPIRAIGYLKNETEIVNGKLKPVQRRFSLGTYRLLYVVLVQFDSLQVNSDLSNAASPDDQERAMKETSKV